MLQVKTFLQVLQSDDNVNDKKEITGMSILSCIETLLSVNDEQPQTLLALEQNVLEVVVHIFTATDSAIGKSMNRLAIEFIYFKENVLF